MREGRGADQAGAAANMSLTSQNLPLEGSGQGGARIEVTPQMIEAGASIWRLAALFSEPLDGGKELVCDVFHAMLLASGASQPEE